MGRPSKLDEEVQAKIVALLRAGNFAAAAARVAGISPRTFWRWMERGEADDEHDVESEFCQFWRSCDRARAEAEAIRVQHIATAGKEGDWRADAWWLERAHPKHWGPPSQRLELDAKTKPPEPPPGAAGDLTRGMASKGGRGMARPAEQQRRGGHR